MDRLNLSSDSIAILGTQESFLKRRVTGHNAKVEGRDKNQKTSEDERGLNKTGVDSIRCCDRHGGKST